MDAAPQSRHAGLVRRVEIRAPLQLNSLVWALFKGEEGVGRRGKGAQTSGEVRRAGDGGEHFGGGAAERAVAGNKTREGGCNESGFLIREPTAGQHPLGAPMVGAIYGLAATAPRVNRHLAHGQTLMASTACSGIGINQLDEICDQRKAI